MMNHLPILVYGLEYDPKLGLKSVRMNYCNKLVSDYIGYSKEEIVNMGFDFYRNVLYSEDLNKATKSIFTILNSDKIEHTEYYRVKQRRSEKYEILKGILRVVKPMPDEGTIQFIVTALFASSEEILQYYLSIDMSDDLFDSLSEREKNIAFLITKGKMTKEIADELCISALTVKKHRSNIRKKLQVKNTAEMVTYLVPHFQYY